MPRSRSRPGRAKTKKDRKGEISQPSSNKSNGAYVSPFAIPHPVYGLPMTGGLSYPNPALFPLHSPNPFLPALRQTPLFPSGPLPPLSLDAGPPSPPPELATPPLPQRSPVNPQTSGNQNFSGEDGLGVDGLETAAAAASPAAQQEPTAVDAAAAIRNLPPWEAARLISQHLDNAAAAARSRDAAVASSAAHIAALQGREAELRRDAARARSAASMAAAAAHRSDASAALAQSAARRPPRQGPPSDLEAPSANGRMGRVVDEFATLPASLRPYNLFPRGAPAGDRGGDQSARYGGGYAPPEALMLPREDPRSTLRPSTLREGDADQASLLSPVGHAASVKTWDDAMRFVVDMEDRYRELIRAKEAAAYHDIIDAERAAVRSAWRRAEDRAARRGERHAPHQFVDATDPFGSARVAAARSAAMDPPLGLVGGDSDDDGSSRRRRRRHPVDEQGAVGDDGAADDAGSIRSGRSGRSSRRAKRSNRGRSPPNTASPPPTVDVSLRPHLVDLRHGAALDANGLKFTKDKTAIVPTNVPPSIPHGIIAAAIPDAGEPLRELQEIRMAADAAVAALRGARAERDAAQRDAEAAACRSAVLERSLAHQTAQVRALDAERGAALLALAAQERSSLDTAARTGPVRRLDDAVNYERRRAAAHSRGLPLEIADADDRGRAAYQYWHQGVDPTAAAAAAAAASAGGRPASAPVIHHPIAVGGNSGAQHLAQSAPGTQGFFHITPTPIGGGGGGGTRSGMWVNGLPPSTTAVGIIMQPGASAQPVRQQQMMAPVIPQQQQDRFFSSHAAPSPRGEGLPSSSDAAAIHNAQQLYLAALREPSQGRVR